MVDALLMVATRARAGCTVLVVATRAHVMVEQSQTLASSMSAITTTTINTTLIIVTTTPTTTATTPTTATTMICLSQRCTPALLEQTAPFQPFSIVFRS